MDPERREDTRLPVAWRACLVRSSGEQLPGSTDNVSFGGVNVIIDRPIPVGEPVHLDITSCVGTCKGWHRLHGLVVYVQPLEGNLGYATGLALRQSPSDFVSQVERLEQQLAVVGQNFCSLG